MKKRQKERVKTKGKRGALFWVPRIISILFILFLTLFSFDVFGSGNSIWLELVGFVIHSLPSIVLIVILIFAWRNSLILSIPFLGFGLWYLTMMIARAFLSSSISWYIAISWSLTIALPALLVGVLFLLDWILRKKN